MAQNQTLIQMISDIAQHREPAIGSEVPQSATIQIFKERGEGIEPAETTNIEVVSVALQIYVELYRMSRLEILDLPQLRFFFLIDLCGQSGTISHR